MAATPRSASRMRKCFLESLKAELEVINLVLVLVSLVVTNVGVS